MKRFSFRVAFLLAFWTASLARAAAQPGIGVQDGQVEIDTGIQSRTIPEIIAGLVDLGHGMAFFVMTTIFLIGGLYMAASGGQESTLAKGKSLMKAALIGMAIVSGSWMILSTFVSFLANG